MEAIDGEVLASRLWMEQRLAYPMDGHQKGTYWLLYFRAEGKRLTELDRAFTLHEGIIREMTLRIDPASGRAHAGSRAWRISSR